MELRKKGDKIHTSHEGMKEEVKGLLNLHQYT